MLHYAKQPKCHEYCHRQELCYMTAAAMLCFDQCMKDSKLGCIELAGMLLRLNQPALVGPPILMFPCTTQLQLQLLADAPAAVNAQQRPDSVAASQQLECFRSSSCTADAQLRVLAAPQQANCDAVSCN